MLTLCTTCKPFTGPSAVAQTNALESWARAGYEVIVLGDETGVPEICERLGLRQVADVPRNEFGTPLVSGLFEVAQRESRTPLVGWVNSDILLGSDLGEAASRVAERHARFLLIARRWNVDLEAAWDFGAADSSAWQERLRDFAQEHGQLEPAFGGMDLFVFPRDVDWQLPAYAVGRGRWDSALVLRARQLGLPVVDATEAVTSVHQNHDYGHIARGQAAAIKGPEAENNEALLGGDSFVFTALNATHRLGPRGLRRQRMLSPALLARRLATAPALYAGLRPLRPAVSALAPFWRRGARRVQRLRAESRSRQRTRATPYPVRIPRQTISKQVPEQGGVETFDTEDAGAINRARMEHLLSLGLSLRGKTVLEAAAGPGYLGQYLVEAGAEVLSIDARAENVARLRQLHPDRKAQVFDLEHDDPDSLGRFDVVFAYGALYHLENPVRAIRQLGSLARDLFLIETQVLDHHLPLLALEEETSCFSQAMRNLGTRPTPSFVAMTLRNAGFGHVYAPDTPPAHRDYRFTWKDDLATQRDGALLRCVFVASRRPLLQPRLIELLS